jgi:hypothetical protein
MQRMHYTSVKERTYTRDGRLMPTEPATQMLRNLLAISRTCFTPAWDASASSVMICVWDRPLCRYKPRMGSTNAFSGCREWRCSIPFLPCRTPQLSAIRRLCNVALVLWRAQLLYSFTPYPARAEALLPL